jgi:hypothetical protein
VFATIPVGTTGLALEHVFRTVFAKPLAAGLLLFINGLILLAGERFRRRATETAPALATVPAGAPVAVGAGPLDENLFTDDLLRDHTSGRSAHDIQVARASDRRVAAIPYRDGVYIGAPRSCSPPR